MALPSGITPKVVTIGIASFADGTLATGRATVSMPVNLVHTPSNRPIFSSEMTVPFVDGSASFTLLPTDAPGLNRIDWTYRLKVEIQGATVQPETIWFLLPTDGPDFVDLDGLVTVPSSAGTPVTVPVVTSVNGQTGAVTIEAGGGGTATTDASLLTAGTLPPARIGDASIADVKLASGTALTPTERTKLTGIAAGATANATDAQLRDRATHTGTQAASTITGLATVATTGAYNDLTGKPAAVSPTTDATALTTGTLPPARIGDGSITAAKVADDVATQAELDPILAAVGYTGTQRGAWAGNVVYAVGDVVTNEGGVFRAVTAHTSNGAGWRYDREKWQALSLPALAPATTVPIRQVDGSNYGSGSLAPPRAGLFQQRPKRFNYSAEKLVFAPQAVGDLVKVSGTNTTISLGTIASGSIVITGGTDAAKWRSAAFATPMDMTNGHLRITFRSSAPSGKWLGVNLTSAGTDYTNNLGANYQPASDNAGDANVWKTISVPIAAMSATGTGATLTAINGILFGLDPAGSGASTLEIGRVAWHPNPTGKAKVILWFDDGGTPNQRAAIKTAAKYGFPVTIASVADNFFANTGGFSADEARYMQDHLGAQFAVHAFAVADHNRPQSGAAIMEQLLDYQHFGLATGLTGFQDMAFWYSGFGGIGTPSDDLLVRQLFRSARGGNSTFAETLPPGNPYATRAAMTGASDTSAGTWQPYVAKAIACNGLAQFVWHDLPTAIQTEFSTFCAWLDANRATVEVTTPERAFDPYCAPTTSITTPGGSTYTPPAVSTARRYLAAAYTPPANAVGVVPLATADFNRGTGLTFAGSGITVANAGVYLVSAEVFFLGGDFGDRTGLITVNGAVVREFGFASTNARPSASATLALAAGDAVGLSVYTSGTTPPAVQGANKKDVGLTVTYVGT